MKGFIKQVTVACGLGTVLFASAGCYHWRNLVDPCWPERYNAIARQSVRDVSNAQANAGHELDQTIMTWHFETSDKGAPTARLNAAGIEQLKLVTRRKPAPDPLIFLQHAQDIPYTQGAKPDDVIRMRDQLNNDRRRAIEEFLRTQTAVLGGGSYQIAVRDLATPGINSRPISGTRPAYAVPGAVPQLEQNFKGSIPSGSSGGGSSGGGGGGGGTTGGTSGGGSGM